MVEEIRKLPWYRRLQLKYQHLFEGEALDP